VAEDEVTSNATLVASVSPVAVARRVYPVPALSMLTPEKIARAAQLRTTLFHRMRAFLERYEFLVCPVNQLPPFPAELEWPREIDGTRLENYLDWMKSCYYITITSHPAISVPAGFTPDGLPVGLQIVGRYREDFSVLQLAHAFESATGTWKRRPALE